MNILRHPRAPLVAGILVIFGLAAYVALYRSSPGELSRAHQAVAGSSFITDCNKCHGQKEVALGCLGCHEEIRQQLTSGRGFHTFLLKDGTPACARCHSEHNGPEFRLVNEVSWDKKSPDDFSHPHVAFTLKGKHEKLACEACHGADRRKPFSLPKFPDRVRSTTFLGLSQECRTCHADPHAGGRASDCASCHGQNAWRPAVGFDHDRHFPLKGGHAGVSCQKCHQVSDAPAAGGGTLGIFGSVRGKSCVDCHRNPHRTDWKSNRCESCHRAADPRWDAAAARLTKAQHALTTFRLDKPHDRVDCRKCHGDGGGFDRSYPDPRKPGYDRAPNRCESCHRDPHGGQFVSRHPRCVECHALSGFRPTTFTARDHSIYPLTGGHLKAACNDCHRVPAGEKIRVFAGASRDCAACHKDVHYGQFRVNGRTACDSCHQSTASWKKLVFDHNRQSVFRLDQAHIDIACSVCHPKVSLGRGMTVVQYKPVRHRCQDCHEVEEGR